MDLFFEPFFREYEKIVKIIDRLVYEISNKYPNFVKCKKKCSDCCYAIFDLTLIEAIYVNYFFNKLDIKKKKKILYLSNKIDRKIYKIKRIAQQNVEKGEKSVEQIIYDMSLYRIQCPLLNSENLCEIYEFRPITCRVYGLPTSFSDMGYSCGLSKFDKGKSYSTIKLNSINVLLHNISKSLINKDNSKYYNIHKVLMPVSMAVLTKFDNIFFGKTFGKDL